MGLGAAVVLAGCTGAVEVDDPGPAGEQASVCQELLDALPESVAGQDRRDVSPDDAAAAAWGDPAIVLRCGVDPPAAMTSAAQLVEVDGVAWLPEELTAGYLFTTSDRVVNVEVAVPDDYTPEATVLVNLAAAVQSAVSPT